MISKNNKYLLVLIIVILSMATLLLSGCDSGNEEQDKKPPTQEVPKETENGDKTNEPTTDVPGTKISLHPSAQLVYEDDEIIVYATNASLNELFNFYRDFSELKSGPASRTEDGFGLETELFSLIRRFDQEGVQKEIDKSGRLMHVMAYTADSEEIDGLFDANIISQLPTEGNILWFIFWTN